jgi:elongation factor P--beta-lysine ligase
MAHMFRGIALLLVGGLLEFCILEWFKPEPDTVSDMPVAENILDDEFESAQLSRDTVPENPSFDESFELEAGDVIKSIDGKSVASISAVQDLYKNYNRIKTVTVLRNGNLVSIGNKYFRSTYDPLLPSITSIKSDIRSGEATVIITYPSLGTKPLLI